MTTKRKGVLLVNLGSPQSPSVEHVREYLGEFLMDKRVLDIPWPIRYMVVHGFILPKRPKLSGEAYEKIWTPEGSPLIVSSKKICMQLGSRVDFPVQLAMRYQKPTIESAVINLAERKVEQLRVIPLFPHYAMSSYESAVERVKEMVRLHAPNMELSVQPPFYDNPHYIQALGVSASSYLDQGFDHLLFSFHGIPERHIRKSDPTGCHCLKVQDCCEVESSAHQYCYRAQCFKTVRAFIVETGIPKDKCSVSFQSRLGRTPWLRPYTDHELVRFGKAGVKKLLVICPAFVSDCLETIEEIGIRGRESFLQSGGKELVRIPCLNEHPGWLASLERMVNEWAANADAKENA